MNADATAQQASALDHLEGLPHEPLHATGHADRCEGDGDGATPNQFGHEAVDGGGVRPAPDHRPAVQAEVAEEAALAVLVALLGQHDLVDEPGGERVGGGQPRDIDAAKTPLQHLQQRHEIPHGEDVVFHEEAQRPQAVDLPVDGVVQEVVLQGREPKPQPLQPGRFARDRLASFVRHPVIIA